MHLILSSVAAIALWTHGSYLFRNYVHPGKIATAALPDIYLITIDTLRAEDMSAYGYLRPTTPNLEKFAKTAFTFEYCFANSNFTTPATASMETGKLPWSHRIFHIGGFLRGGAQHENLGAVLKQQGYYTAMITSNAVAAPFRHRTMESYDAVEYVSPLGLGGLHGRYTNLVGVNTQATLIFSLVRVLPRLAQYLDKRIWHDRYPSPAEPVFRRASLLIERQVPQPFFLWAHVLPPHDPYWVPPVYRHTFVSKAVARYDDFSPTDAGIPRPGISIQELRASYDEMVLYTDHVVGEFLDWLSQTGHLEKAIVIISADHGEFFEHNRLGHGGPDLYDGVIRVPLLIHLPGQQQGVVVSQLAQQADLLPTLLENIRAGAVRWTDGISLKPALQGRALPDRYIFAMNLEPNPIFDPISKGTVAIMDGQYKFLSYLGSRRQELYRYKVDKDEQSNLVDSEPEIAARMRTDLANKLEEVNAGFGGKP
jgi:arylsulfatase A-like enzyme